MTVMVSCVDADVSELSTPPLQDNVTVKSLSLVI